MRPQMIVAAMLTIAASEFVRRLIDRDDLDDDQRERVDRVSELPPTLPITVDETTFPAAAFDDLVTPREPRSNPKVDHEPEPEPEPGPEPEPEEAPEPKPTPEPESTRKPRPRL